MRRLVAHLIVFLTVALPALCQPVWPITANPPLNYIPPYYAQGLISYGQSWDVNCWPTFALYGINTQPQILLTPFEANLIVPSGSRPLSTGAGITGVSYPAVINGLTGLAATDCIQIGRAAVLAQSLYRQMQNLPSQRQALFQFAAGYPGSTWTSGGGGGLGPGDTNFTASITNNLMTVTAVANGPIATGQKLSGAGVPAGQYYILLGGSGTGGNGTYPVEIAQTTLPVTFVTAHATFFGGLGGGAPNNVLTVTNVLSGTITAGDSLPQPAMTGSVLDAFGGNCDGTTCTGSGGNGTYSVTVGTPLNITSQSFQSFGVSWNNMVAIIADINGIGGTGYNAVPRGPIEGICYTAVEYTQGGAADLTLASKLSDLTAMFQLFDGMSLTCGGSQLYYYLQLPAAVSESTGPYPISDYGTEQFCINNAPNAGGPYSRRVFCTEPSYAWPFNGADDIHTGAYGTAQWGAGIAYVRNQVEDQGNTNWTPLWRALGMSPVVDTVHQTITLTYSRPTSADFATAPLVWQSSPNDGIKVWPQYGFHLKVNGVECAVSPAIVSLTVVLTPLRGCSWVSGDTLEPSDAWYGPGGPNPGNNSGIGGNLAIQGPASGIMPGAPFFMWAWPSDETVTAP